MKKLQEKFDFYMKDLKNEEFQNKQEYDLNSIEFNRQDSMILNLKSKMRKYIHKENR